MNTRKLFNWLVMLILLLPLPLASPSATPTRAALGSLQTLTTTLDHSDDLTDLGKDGGVSLQELRRRDVKIAQRNEAKRATATASSSSSFDRIRQVTTEPDTDDDGMPNAWESANGLNPNDPSDAWTDPDGDYVINLFEYQLSSDPNNASTPAVVTVSAGQDVEAAIESATMGQVIRVEGGTYNMNYITFSPKTIMIQGGWNGDFTHRDLDATPTTFDGQSLDEVLYFAFSSGTNSVILDGLTLTNGKGFFGALNMLAEGTSIIKWSIMNCTIVDSESTNDFGGATHILHWDSSESDVFITNSIVANNNSSGIYNQTTETAVGRWKIINSDITNNQSTDADEGYGTDGFTLDDAVLTIKLKNTILWGNQKTDLEVHRSIAVEAEYSDIGTVNAAYGATYSAGAGVIDSDPLFVAPGSGDFALQRVSPCIDAGSSSGVPPIDFEGDPRPLDGDNNGDARWDIGADEFDPRHLQPSSITGRVLDSSGIPIAGVEITTSAGHSVTTDANGQYVLADVLPGTYILTPTKTGYFWSPARRTVTVPPDATGQDFTAQNIQKTVAPGGLHAVGYGDSLTYTVRQVFPEGRTVVLYDRIPTYTTYISGSLSAPTGVNYDPVAGAISGVLNLAAATPTAVSFAVRVEVTGTAEWAPPIVNRACVYPLGGGLAECMWSNEARSYTYVWSNYLPIIMR